MSKSWGHSIRRYATGEVTQTSYIPWNGTEADRRFYWHPNNCQGRDCTEIPVYETRCYYVTGQAGRVTDRRQSACQKHGEAFAKKHALPLADTNTVPASSL